MSRLDQILGKQGSKAKDVYASKISLASRVVKVERSVSNKLNINGMHARKPNESKYGRIDSDQLKPINLFNLGC